MPSVNVICFVCIFQFPEIDGPGQKCQCSRYAVCLFTEEYFSTLSISSKAPEVSSCVVPKKNHEDVILSPESEEIRDDSWSPIDTDDDNERYGYLDDLPRLEETYYKNALISSTKEPLASNTCNYVCLDHGSAVYRVSSSGNDNVIIKSTGER
ncbi:hypothetical protein SK128_018998 [Halocaridina rubra]|uniref:Uncharacterized protein n=1 Tax=Halocaridina rubra TaxID=373956 RepID=A0AAN8WWX8_HALRR